ncbi:hypothetical protein CBP51_01665 [Cellvibrio mixtus]|jgi:hypothetical protein|uniref:Uncharacterized protein n=1 Tax=Cellvibrio mixtus TaxID=39650 RepID=A0A266Q7G4_9GAMM|nr:hypothetical protein [Cellvibrio mixtus]OZY85782.1 hypothetical protein CBP51_01665 [Cellvibrio mixtus]
MASSHPLKTPITKPDQSLTPAGSSAVVKAVAMGELVLSVSTMLGCDYIFVSHIGPHALLSQQHLHRTIRELLDMLDTSPRQSLIVSADERLDGQLSFTRYDYIWENRKVVRVSPTLISNQEQIDFMQMMFDCSSTC